MIQNAILQMLGTAGIASGLYQQTDTYKVNKQFKTLTKQQEQLEKSDAYGTGTLEGAKKQLEIAETRHSLKPSEETAKEIGERQEKVQEIMDTMELARIRAAEAATSRAQILDAQGNAISTVTRKLEGK